jgi:hypothetical protein
MIQVIGCNRYSTGTRWNEVDRTIGSWDIDIKNELLAAILENGVLVANMSQCSGLPGQKFSTKKYLQFHISHSLL